MIKDSKVYVVRRLFDIGERGVTEFYVPKYQRNYSWDKEKISSFWDDIYDSFQTKQKHFIGSVLIEAQNGEPGKFEVIDGQQRLATITAMFAAIRDILNDENLDLRLPNEIQERYIQDRNRHGKEFLRLQLNKYDQNYFRAKIQDKESYFRGSKRWVTHSTGRPPKSHLLLKLVHQEFTGRLLGSMKNLKTRAERLQFLTEIVSHVEENIYVVAIFVEDKSDAFSIFETLNDRGLELSTADLLKNYIFSRGEKASLTEEMEQSWDSISKTLDTTELISFLRYFWISKNGPLESKKDKNLYRAVKDGLDIEAPSRVAQFVKDLDQEATTYNALLVPTQEYWKQEETIETLSALRVLNVRQVFPILLSAYRKNGESEDFNKIAKLCLNISFRYSTIANENPNRLEEIYGKIAKLVDREKISLNKITEEFLNINPDTTTFIESFTQKDFKNSKLAKYVLIQLESITMPEIYDEYSIDKNITLEHIMPKKQKKEWWPDNIYDDSVIFNIGNLSLLGEEKNRKASNKSFLEKKNVVYSKSHISMTKELCKSKSWDSTKIDKRGLSFAHKADAIWSVG